MATFHLFSRLPAELRIQIWQLTLESRPVDVRMDRRDANPSRLLTTHLISSTRTPAPLQTCREARSHAPYRQEFAELAAPDGSGRRYVWINFDTDVICVGTSWFSDYEAVAPKVQRLTFWGKNPHRDACFYPLELEIFFNVRKIYVVSDVDLWEWDNTVDEYTWPCGNENVFFIDPEDDRMIRARDMHRIFDKKIAEFKARGLDHPRNEKELVRGAKELIRDAKEPIPNVVSWVGELSRSLSEVPNASEVRSV